MAMEDNQIVIYESEGGEAKVEVKLSQETLWLTLNQMATLFGRDKSVISRHLKNIYAKGELDLEATVAYFATVQIEGEHQVERKIEYYNLDAIISVGYLVNSKRGVQFRKWSSNVLKKYLIDGYCLYQERLVGSKLEELKQTIALLSNTLIKQDLISSAIGKEIIEIIHTYAKTWEVLIRYDQDKLALPDNITEDDTIKDWSVVYPEAKSAIRSLKKELAQKNQATRFFRLEHGQGLSSILGNVEQSFDNKPLYRSPEEKAARLLYFIIKDHPFVDGNKRIGSLLFLLYLVKNGIKPIAPNTMTALALLTAVSEPIQEDLVIKLILNLIAE
jgi:prophage maintenance system killer protein